MGHVEIADGLLGRQLAGLLLEIAEHDALHAAQDAQEADARPVDADVANQQARSGHQHAGCDQEGRRAGVARDPDAVEQQLVGVDDGDVAAVTVDRDAGAQQHALGVVAAASGLADGGGAVGCERRQQDARLDLGARHLELP